MTDILPNSLLSQLIGTLEVGQTPNNPASIVAIALRLFFQETRYLDGQCSDIIENENKKILRILELVGWGKMSIEKITEAVDKILKDNPKAVGDYLSGKMKGVNWFVGKFYKELGNVNVGATDISEIFMERLSK